jgi:periplasmic divalent cation tolerance protein
MEIVVLVTSPSSALARKIAHGLLEERLCACVNIISKIESLYWWQDKIESAPEVLLVIKTRKGLFSRLQKAVRRLHSYQVPEVISLDISAGNPGYLAWVRKETGINEATT